MGNYPLFVKYDTGFTTNTDFQVPKSVPHQAIWSRFRLEGKSRLIGFVLPDLVLFYLMNIKIKNKTKVTIALM